MSKAVIISIRPKWCELIASGKKTVEVRKTAPKLEAPFKCYIYCTTNGDTIRTAPKPYCKNVDGSTIYRQEIMNGKVIGEFVCDEVAHLNIDSVGVTDGGGYYLDERGWKSCLSRKQLIEYCGIKRPYGWHISDLKIYDKPKELGDFERWENYGEDIRPCQNGKHCKHLVYDYSEDCQACAIDFDGTDCPYLRVTRPPQSWMYVEEES